MAASLADIGQLAERLGVTIVPDSATGLRAQAALDDASALIRSEGAAWPDPNLAPDIVVAVCLAVAMRAYRNPDGVTQASVGDVAVTYSAGATGGGAIFLMKNELRAVRKAAGVMPASSVVMESDFEGTGDPAYTDVEGTTEQIPLGPAPWE